MSTSSCLSQYNPVLLYTYNTAKTQYYIQNIVSAVENENHCDFVKLREMLIRTNMEDMRENTHSKHYELFRRNKLQEMGFSENESKR